MSERTVEGVMKIMKNKAKRVLSLLLAVVMLVPFALPAFAESDEIVARVSIVSYLKNAFSTGHSWLYIENLSDKTLTVGIYQLEPGDSVSVGTFKNSRKEGRGIYYNVERYCVNKFGASARYSLSETVTESELNGISRKINSYSGKWTPVKNCAYFAAYVWNSISKIHLISGSTPSCLRTSIRLHGGKRGIAMSDVSADNVYKQDGSSLRVVRASALNKGL